MFSLQVDKYKFRAGLNLKEIHKQKLKGVLHPIILYTKHVYTECTAEGLADQQVSDGGPRSL